MSKCPPNSPFDSSDNKQIVSRLSHNRSSPLDQWQSRCQTPVNYNNNYNSNDINYRPIVNNLPINLYQRVFTPRSSYLSPSNNLVISSTPTINPNINNSFHQLCNNSNNEPSYENFNHLVVREANRPVYMTPDANQTNPINSLSRADIDFSSLKSVSHLFNNISESDSIETKCESPENTVSNNSTSNRMTDLIEEMKKLTDEELENTRHRRDIELKISQLDQELKDYEQKIQLRDELRKLKDQMNLKEERLQKRRKSLLSQMEKCQNSQQSTNKESNNNPIVNSEISEVTQTTCDKIKIKETDNKDKNNRTESTHENIREKRPIAPTSKTNPVKKVKINCEISSTDGKGANQVVKTVPRTFGKVYPKTPHVKKPIANANQTQSKINRLCRQQTQKPTAASSGVKSSRPQKVSSSRLKKPIVATDDQQQTPTLHKSSDESNNLVVNIDSERNSEPKSVSDADYDNEVFSELAKHYDNKDNPSLKSSDKNTIASNPLTSTDPNPIEDSHKNSNQINETNVSQSERFEQNTDVNQNTEQRSNFNSNSNVRQNSEQSHDPIAEETNDSNNLKTNKMIELVENDNRSEEYAPTPQQLMKVKEEKIDGKCVTTNEQLERLKDKHENRACEEANNIISNEPMISMRLKSSISKGSNESCSDGSKDQIDSKASSNDNNQVLMAPVVPKTKNPKFKYYGIEAEEFAPTVRYSISSFKAIAGPKSKTAKTTVIFLKSFKDYMLASFTDCTLRRYHIENKNDVLKYEGHEDFVLSLTLSSCPTSSTIFLYTGCKDHILRVFNAMTGTLLSKIQLTDEISCLDCSWSHVFAGLKDGNLCKIKLFNENETQSGTANNVQNFLVNPNKRICAIKTITTDRPEADCQPVLVVSNTRIRILNTVSSIEDDKRILYSLNINFCLPIYLQIYQKYLFIAFKLPPIKSEDRKKRDDNSKVLVYDLQKDWKPIREIDVKGIVTSLEMNKRDLIISSYSGKIQCVDCEKLELKWIAYHSLITASVMIGDRLILGNEEGLIDVIYLDGQMLDCDLCGITFARQVDFKHHIKQEHDASHSSSQNN